MPHNLETYQPELSEAAGYFTLRRDILTGELEESGLTDDRVRHVREEWKERHYWEGLEYFLEDPNFYFRGVKDGKKPQGYIVGQHRWNEDPDCKYISYLGVHEESRRQGVATRLIEDFHQTDSRPTCLYVFENNAGAKKLYKNCDFVAVEGAPLRPWLIVGQRMYLELFRRGGANV